MGFLQRTTNEESVKNSIPFFISFMFTTFFAFAACESVSENIGRTENGVMISDRQVGMAESGVLAEVQAFRFKIANDVKANFREMAAIQDTIDSIYDNIRVNYKDKLALLDNINREMKRTINNFSVSGRDQWMVFRDEFSDSMDSLGTSLDNFFVISDNSINN